MGQSDWSALTGDVLNSSQVAAGVVSFPNKPNGGGNFVYGWNSIAAVTGAQGIFANQADFIDMAYGAVLTFCVMRGSGAYTTGFAPMGYIGVGANGGGTTVDEFGYLLGLADSDPYQIVLRKGRLIDGLPNTAPTVGIGAQPNGCNMRRGSVTFSPNTWHQLQLGVAVNASGEIIIAAQQNDLSAHACTSPVWEDIPGILPISDDELQVNTGSAPLIPYGTATSKGGVAFWVSGISRRAYVDHITLRKQLAP